MKIRFLLFIGCFAARFVTAQEVKTPLGINVVLQHHQKDHWKATAQLGKGTTVSFPFSDYFNTNSSKPDTAKWLDSVVTQSPLWAVFNGLDAGRNKYATSFSQADVLTSTLINTQQAPSVTFIHFVYALGKNWQSNDSLVLQIKNTLDVWQSIWRSSATAFSGNKEVFLNLDMKGLQKNNFQFRFINYCNTDSLVSEDFLLSRFIFSSKNTLPFYENFRSFNGISKLPLAVNWSSFRNEITRGDSLGMKWGNAILFNSITDRKDSAYFNANNQYGPCDTLLLNPIDLSVYEPDEFVYMSFWYRTLSNSRAGDSLFVDVLDNLGVWQRAWAVRGGSSSFGKVTLALNAGRYRHSLCMLRFINAGTYANSDTMNYAVAAIKVTAKTGIPFVEDFSSTKVYPERKKWNDKKVFVNNTFPQNQPSFNVATFDGLDEAGAPYSRIVGNGYCDYLTSRGVDLSSFTPADSVFMSFFYQYEPQGTTQQIFPMDSLLLEFRTSPNDADSFEQVWVKSALDTPLGVFRQVIFPVGKKYLHDDFQFRFRNYGSLTGNLSQWHLDYIRINQNRNRNDTANTDVAISQTPTSLLKKYRSMPWTHFSINPSKYLNTDQFFSVSNNNNVSYALDYRRRLFNPEGTQTAFSQAFLPNIDTFGITPIVLSQPLAVATGSSADEKVFTVTLATSYNQFTSFDNIPTNDSMVTVTTFANYFAYDDGSAEGGYGIKKKPNSGAALAFDLEKMDTLLGVQIFFNRSEEDVSNRVFDLVVWSQISPVGQNATTDAVALRIKNLKPVYTNTINGFAAFKFEPPVLVGTRFYIGWEQLAEYVLNIGLDENYMTDGKPAINPNMFAKFDGRWYNSEIYGTMMVRPMFGKYTDPSLSHGEVEYTEMEYGVSVFPNPTNGTLYMNSKSTIKNLLLFDLTGREVMHRTGPLTTIDLSGLPKGLYFLRVQDEYGKTSSKKIIRD